MGEIYATGEFTYFESHGSLYGSIVDGITFYFCKIG